MECRSPGCCGRVPVMFAGGELAGWIPGGLRPTGIPLRGLARVAQARFGWGSRRGHTRSEWDGFRGPKFVEVQVPVMFAGGELAVWIPGGLRPTGIPLRGLARVTQARFG
jgi:hypothetical protein